jgi:hypothetical protein
VGFAERPEEIPLEIVAEPNVPVRFAKNVFPSGIVFLGGV